MGDDDVPVEVVAPVAAVPELTEEGHLGVLVPEATAQSLADAVLTTYRRPQAELDAITREAQKRALRLYNWDAVARRVLESVVNGSVTRRLGDRHL